MFVSPMLLHKSEKPFDSNNFLCELKLDGFRLIYSNMEQPKLYTRHKTDVTYRFRELLDLPIPKGTILDGELISIKDGKPSFEAVMKRFQSNRPTIPVTYCVFDVLFYKGESVMHLPLIKRKVLLSKIIPKDLINLVNVRWIRGNGKAYFQSCKKQDLEGIVLKEADSTYDKGIRGKQWYKVIHYQYLQNVVIMGFRKDKFGWLLGIKRNGDLRHVGICEFVPEKERKAFYHVAQQIKIRETDKYVYIKPVLRCNIKFRNWTTKQLLRIPTFIEFANIQKTTV